MIIKKKAGFFEGGRSTPTQLEEKKKCRRRKSSFSDLFSVRKKEQWGDLPLFFPLERKKRPRQKKNEALYDPMC